MLWNQAMSNLTGIPPGDVLGIPLKAIPSPWNHLLSDFMDYPEDHLYKHQVDLEGPAGHQGSHPLLQSP